MSLKGFDLNEKEYAEYPKTLYMDFYLHLLNYLSASDLLYEVVTLLFRFFLLYFLFNN